MFARRPANGSCLAPCDAFSVPDPAGSSINHRHSAGWFSRHGYPLLGSSDGVDQDRITDTPPLPDRGQRGFGFGQLGDRHCHGDEDRSDGRQDMVAVWPRSRSADMVSAWDYPARDMVISPLHPELSRFISRSTLRTFRAEARVEWGGRRHCVIRTARSEALNRLP
jgi:hypothetical protein